MRTPAYEPGPRPTMICSGRPNRSRQRLTAFDPIKIEMINRQSPIAVFVDKNKSGTRHIRLASQARDEPLHELRFPRTEIAAQGQHIAPARLLAVRPPGRDRLLSAV